MAEQKTSKRLNFRKLNNTRDLGGMRAADGRVIREGRLIRSGQLFFADEEDIRQLNEMGIRKIFDFRSRQERLEKPDPEIDGAINTHLPIVRDIAAGLSRDKRSDGMAFDLVIQSVKTQPGFGIQYMSDTYLKMVREEFAVSQYARFIRNLADTPEGAVLWHCTAGKDRAGFASVLVQEILGVSREDILEDYLATNLYLKEEINQILGMLDAKMDLEDARDEVIEFFGAKEEYIGMIYRYVQENYGGMMQFIHDGMEIEEEIQERIRELYLV